MTTPTAGVTPSGASAWPLITSRSPGSDGAAMMPPALTPLGGAGVGGGPIWAARTGIYSRGTIKSNRGERLVIYASGDKTQHRRDVLTTKSCPTKAQLEVPSPRDS